MRFPMHLSGKFSNNRDNRRVIFVFPIDIFFFVCYS